VVIRTTNKHTQTNKRTFNKLSLRNSSKKQQKYQPAELGAPGGRKQNQSDCAAVLLKSPVALAAGGQNNVSDYYCDIM
jgi:hypothetical protein